MATYKVENGALDDLANGLTSGQRGTAESLYQTTNGQLLTLNETLMLNTWSKKGLVRTFVCLPVDDALKGGVKIKADNLDDEACRQLQDIFKKEAMQDVAEAGYWARHFGGGALIALSEEDNAEPFDIKRKNQSVSFMAVDRWRLPARAGYTKEFVQVSYSSNQLNLDLGKKTKDYNNGSNTRWMNKSTVNGKPIDKSRIKIIMGDSCPIITRQTVSGWGLSVYEKCAEDFDTYEKTMNLIHELMLEGKINVMKVDGLMNSLRAGEIDDVLKVIRKLGEVKTQTRNMIMDGKDDFMQTQASLAGFADVIKIAMARLASGLRIPQTKYFGTTPAGFNSGEGDIENYNAMIESTIRPNLRPLVQWSLEILCASRLGVEPQNLSFEFMPLREVKPKEQEEINTMKQARYMELADRGALSDEELKEKMELEKLI